MMSAGGVGGHRYIERPGVKSTRPKLVIFQLLGSAASIQNELMLAIGAIVWGVRDLQNSISFWCQALNYKVRGEPSDDFAILVPAEGRGIQLSLNAAVTSDKPRRHHMDLFTHEQDSEVDRLVKLGASRVDWRYETGADYVVLADPDGNTFCVVQL